MKEIYIEQGFIQPKQPPDVIIYLSQHLGSRFSKTSLGVMPSPIECGRENERGREREGGREGRREGGRSKGTLMGRVPVGECEFESHFRQLVVF